MKHPLACALALALAAGTPALTYAPAAAAQTQGSAVQTPASNPFFADSTLPLHYPDFAKIKDTRLRPGLRPGHGRTARRNRRIANDPSEPTFDNTILAMEKNGRTLTRAATVFFNLLGADKNDAREKIDDDVFAQASPRTATRST